MAKSGNDATAWSWTARYLGIEKKSFNISVYGLDMISYELVHGEAAHVVGEAVQSLEQKKTSELLDQDRSRELDEECHRRRLPPRRIPRGRIVWSVSQPYRVRTESYRSIRNTRSMYTMSFVAVMRVSLVQV